MKTEHIPSIEWQAANELFESIGGFKHGSIYQKLDPTKPSKTLSGQHFMIIDEHGNELEVSVILKHKA